MIAPLIDLWRRSLRALLVAQHKNVSIKVLLTYGLLDDITNKTAILTVLQPQA